MSDKKESQSELNQVIRVLKGERLKYTVRICCKDGRQIEFQSANPCKPDWKYEDRAMWLDNGQPVCRYEDGMIVVHEVNPE